MKQSKKPDCIFLAVLFILGFANFASAQERLAPGIYLVRFTDKKQNNYTLHDPSQFLSSRALLRRSIQLLPLQDNDLPVSATYIDSLRKIGFYVLNASKWMNGVTIKTTSESLLNKLDSISFVKHTAKSITLKAASVTHKKLETFSPYTVSSSSSLYGASFTQIAIHHGNYLHELGYRGQGMLIGVIDAGFNNARNMSALDSLWLENRVLLTRDVVNAGNVFALDSHGSMVLSVMASTAPGTLLGTAPMANYLLLRSEEADQEYPVEEFNWAVAAELADSMGTDVINTSLGYTTFDDASLNHTYRDMNGHSTIISQAAAVAASKGIIVVVSAGNEGANSWKYISAPAGADSVLTVGAIDKNLHIATFSSRGPTADGRIKPDVVAMGEGTLVQQPDNLFSYANGTSFSSPVIAGLTACLWQAFPNKTNMAIIRAIQQSSSRYDTPDSIFGYGIPDFKKAWEALSSAPTVTQNELVVIPNPFSEELLLILDAVPGGQIHCVVYNVVGRKVYEKHYAVSSTSQNRIYISELALLPRGMYIVTVFSGSEILKNRILKM